MEKVDKVVSLPKNSAELSDHIGKFVLACKKALDDGWQVGQDVPAIASAALVDLLPALSAASGVGSELSEDGLDVAKAFALAGFDIAHAFKKPAA